MEMTKMNVIMVGCGKVAIEHLRAFHKIPKVQVVAVCDVNEQLAAETAKSWNVPKFYNKLDQALANHQVQIVDICTPPQTHKDLCIQALKSGSHVLVEKPMAMTLSEAKDIITLARITERKVGVVHNWLFEPAMRRALTMAQQKKLGQILHVDVRVLQTNKDPMLINKNHWCHSLPGGRLAEVLPHPIYILQSLLGSLSVKSVLAKKIGGYPWVRYDELYVSFEGKEGVGSAYLSFNAPRDMIFIDIYGTKTVLKVDLVGQTITLTRHGSTRRSAKVLKNLCQAYQLIVSTVCSGFLVAFGLWKSGHEEYIQRFIRSIQLNKPLPVTMTSAYENIKVLEQICSIIEA